MPAEDAGWNELHALVDSLTPQEAERPGYYPEGWSASDLLGHIGSWLAAAGTVLERIRTGTYPEEIDVVEAGLTERGFSDEDIVDAVHCIAYFNFINRVLDGLGVDPESFMRYPRETL